MNRLTCVLTTLAVLVACSSRDSIHKSLEAAVNAGVESIVLREHTDFEWDTVHVYGPYSPFNEINKKHNLNLRSKGRYEGDFVSEGDCLYVFSLNGQTRRTSFGPRHCGGILKPGVYSSQDAVFGVKRQGSIWELITLSSSNRLERPSGPLPHPLAAQPPR